MPLTPYTSDRMTRSRAIKAILGTLVVYALLVAPHEGEFWPFTIYPMFSQAGNPWSRAVVYDVTDALDEEKALRWAPVQDRDSLAGTPFALGAHGIDPIDYANFVSKTETWHTARVQGLRQMFHDQLDDRALLAIRVNGELTDADSVVVEYEPYVLMTPDDTRLNPDLPTDRAAR